MFRIRHLTKSYGNRIVLDIEELELTNYTIYALLGPNGSGKTTLLEILALLQKPDSGEVIYDDKRIDYTSGDLDSLRRQIVLVQQNPVLFTTSVFKNLEFGLKIRGIHAKEREKRIDEALDLVDMREFKHTHAPNLSGGETQRIAIAMALSCFPKVLLFDEPFASVDVENQIVIERIITQILNEKNIFVIFTSHNMEQTSRLSHKVISLSNGKPVSGWIHNLFFGQMHGDVDGKPMCRVQGLIDLSVESKKTGHVRLTIDPMRILLVREVISGMGNAVPGRIKAVFDEGDLARITVDTGIMISLFIKKEDLKSYLLSLGEEVAIRIPPGAVQII